MKPTHPIALLAALLLIPIACQKDEPADTHDSTVPPIVETGFLVSLDLDSAGKPFGDLFRSVNLDAGKQMNDASDYDRIQRLMCPDPTNCTPGPVRFWDKVNHGRFALKAPLAHKDVLQTLHAREFPVFWSMMGVPAFLRDTCSGCVVGEGENTHHLLREVSLAADDERNPTGADVNCACESSGWSAGMPSMTPVGGVSYLDYIEKTTADLLENFDDSDADLRIGVWNEPDQLWWNGQQGQFVALWCATAEAMRGVLGSRLDVLIGGPDVSSWDGTIGGTETPLLQAIQTTCGNTDFYDFLTYHQYSESGKLIFEDSVNAVRAWAEDTELPIDVGEYAASLGHGAEASTPCDPTAIAEKDDLVPTPTGEDPSAVLCDHRGAVEDVAMAATMAEQDHDRLYRFEIWDWGTVDMVNSRMGLLTINNLPKPAATGFWMLSHLQGERVAVINQLDGEHPYHLLASREGDELVVVVAAQDRTVSEQFVRGLLAQGLKFNEDVLPVLAICPAFQSDDPEAHIAALAEAGTTADQIIADCASIDVALAEALAEALAYAAPRVGLVGQSFDLTITLPDWTGSATRYRVDAHRNTFAESYRQWPDGEFAKEGFDYAAAEASLWDYMIDPLDELQVVDSRITIEIRPESVTLLRSEIR
jgi:hypothetical protein